MIECLDSRRNLQRRIALVERTQIVRGPRQNLRPDACQRRNTVRDDRPCERKRSEGNEHRRQEFRRQNFAHQAAAFVQRLPDLYRESRRRTNGRNEIGRASCRERVETSEVAEYVTKKE